MTLLAVLVLAFCRGDAGGRAPGGGGAGLAACTVVLVAGRFLHGAGTPSAYLPPLLTGFEAGMMGYAIFAAVYGAENVFQLRRRGSGQVIFVFFIPCRLCSACMGTGGLAGGDDGACFHHAGHSEHFAGIVLNRFGVIPD